MWKCPKCGREFKRKDQPHSCRTWPVENHFKNKENVRPLFEEFKKKLEEAVGPFKVRSLHCCMHFVSDFSFLATFPMKDRIKIHFVVGRRIENPRIVNSVKITKKNYKYRVDVRTKEELDDELMSWLKDAYNLRNS
jgi:hypothetical protein